MKTVDIEEARKQLSHLVEQAAAGEPFVIARAGKPLVKVLPLDALAGSGIKRLGFLRGAFTTPDDFNRMGTTEIVERFGLRL